MLRMIFQHLKTVCKHKAIVCLECIKCGFIWRGLMHDNSKFGLTEFFASAKHFQGNRLKLASPEWYVFTLIEDGKRAGLERMLKVCVELGLPHVPIEETGTNLPAKYPTVESILERAEGEKEGIVIRPVKALYSVLTRSYLSMKAVNNGYLLKNDN